MIQKDPVVAHVVDFLLVDGGQGSPYDRIRREGGAPGAAAAGGDVGGKETAAPPPRPAGPDEARPYGSSAKSGVVEGFEEGGDCLPLQKCNEREFVYIREI